jgi:hypothetical protein
VDALLADLSALMSPGSRLLFDFMHTPGAPSSSGGSGSGGGGGAWEPPGFASLAAAVANKGSPLRSGLRPSFSGGVRRFSARRPGLLQLHNIAALSFGTLPIAAASTLGPPLPVAATPPTFAACSPGEALPAPSLPSDPTAASPRGGPPLPATGQRWQQQQQPLCCGLTGQAGGGRGGAQARAAACQRQQQSAICSRVFQPGRGSEGR